MFQCTFRNTSTHKKMLESLKELGDMILFTVDERGIYTQFMDPSHVALCELTLRPSSCKSFSFQPPPSPPPKNQEEEEEEKKPLNIQVGLSMNEMCKVLKTVKPESSQITWKYEKNKKKNDYLFVIIDTPNQSATYSFKLFDVDDVRLPIPDSSYPCIIKMNPSRFQQLCKDLSIVGSHMKICVQKPGKVFVSSRGDSSDVKVNVTDLKCKKKRLLEEEEEEEPDVILRESMEELSNTYSLKFLSACTKATELSSLLILQMGQETPLELQYPMQDNENDLNEQTGLLRFFVSPQTVDAIQDEDDPDMPSRPQHVETGVEEETPAMQDDELL